MKYEPSCQVWVECCYIAQNHTYFVDPLCFAITLQLIIERIKSEIPHLLCNAYLDDMAHCVSGTPQDLSTQALP